MNLVLERRSSVNEKEPLALSRKTSAQNHDELSPALQSTKSHVLQRGTRRHQGKAQREVAVTRAVSLVPSPAALFGANQMRNGHASAVLNASTVCGGNLTAARAWIACATAPHGAPRCLVPLGLGRVMGWQPTAWVGEFLSS
ncbi:hypothetical protein Trydic_g9989 [Trypoxylus dichotomus]